MILQGFDRPEGGGIDLISNIITRLLGIQMAVLMGANLAGEVADGNFCETTIGEFYLAMYLQIRLLYTY